MKAILILLIKSCKIYICLKLIVDPLFGAQHREIFAILTLAPPRGIGVTLNPKGGQNDPTRKIAFMIVFKLLLIFFLFSTLQKGKNATKIRPLSFIVFA